MKPKLVPDHEGTYINMQRLIQVQGEHVVTGVPARYVMGLIEELNAAKQRERVLREAATAAGRLADAMETCHECKGTVLVDEQPTHCEDCSWDCESHGGSECPTLYGLHRELKRKLSALATPAPEQPAPTNTCPDCKRPWSEHTAHTSDPLLQNCPASADERGESRRQMSGRECRLCKPATEQGKEPR